MRLAAADEDRRPAVAVTCGTAALLATELLAGARHIAAFAGGTRRTTALFELPGNDAMQDVGAGVDTEDVVFEFDSGLLCRSAERRVGTECVSTVRSRWWRDH